MNTFFKFTLIAVIAALVSCKQNPSETPEHKAMVVEHDSMGRISRRNGNGT